MNRRIDYLQRNLPAEVTEGETEAPEASFLWRLNPVGNIEATGGGLHPLSGGRWRSSALIYPRRSAHGITQVQ